MFGTHVWYAWRARMRLNEGASRHKALVKHQIALLDDRFVRDSLMAWNLNCDSRNSTNIRRVHRKMKGTVVYRFQRVCVWFKSGSSSMGPIPTTAFHHLELQKYRRFVCFMTLQSSDMLRNRLQAVVATRCMHRPGDIVAVEHLLS